MSSTGIICTDMTNIFIDKKTEIKIFFTSLIRILEGFYGQMPPFIEKKSCNTLQFPLH